MKRFKIIALLLNLILAAAVGVGVEAATVSAGFELQAVGPLVASVVFVMGLVPKTVLGFSFALQTEVWVRDIEEKLFEGSEFVNMSIDHDEFIVNAIVHIPQAGSAPGIVKNRAVFPAVITERTDTDNTYPTDSFSTDPIRVRDFEDIQLSYSKRQSVMGQHIDVLNEEIGTQVAFNWAPEGDNTKVILTTGAATSLGPDGVTARKLLTTTDIAKAAAKLDKDKVGKSGRFALLSIDMYYELFGIDALLRKDFMNRVALPTGVINELLGFQILVRPTVVIYDVVAPAAPVREAIGSAADATSSFGAIFWGQSYVAKARGSINVFLEEKSPTNYGDVMSAEVILGSAKMRNDARSTGIVAIAQGA